MVTEPASEEAPAEPRRLKLLSTNADDTQDTRLIFVDDDDLYRSIVKSELEEEGFTVLDFASGEAMLASLADGTQADIIMLDWELNGVQGIDLLPLMCEARIDLPVVFLTGHSSPIHERLAFERGAVDFIDKSRDVRIVAARLRLVVRKQPAPTEPAEVVCGHLVLKPETGRALWRGVDLELTISEFLVVATLVDKAGGVASYRDIYDAIHYSGFMAGYGEDGFRTNVRSTIKRIRSKFRTHDPDFSQIINFSGFGYSWGYRTS